jgi:uncharacterized protein YcfJ
LGDIMKKKAVLFSAALATLGAFAVTAQAEELGRVISTTPVMQQVGVPRQVCTNQQVATPTGPSGAGAIMGGIAGAAIGNGVGGGSGRAAATALGILGGAVLGNNIEGNRGTQVQNVQQCSTQTYYETRTVAYNVVYEYAGKQYSVQMPQDPGPYVRLQVTPIGGSGPTMGPTSQAPAPAVSYSAPVISQVAYTYVQPYVQQAVFYGPSPVIYRPAYYAAPFPGSLSLGFGFYGGGHGRRHWH